MCSDLEQRKLEVSRSNLKVIADLFKNPVLDHMLFPIDFDQGNFYPQILNVKYKPVKFKVS